MIRVLIICCLLMIAATGASAAETTGLNMLVRLLSESDDAVFQRDILTGISEGLEGHRRVEMPAVWPAAMANLQQSRSRTVRDLAIQLALVFDDPDAVRLLRDRAMQTQGTAAERNRAVELLVAKKDVGFAELLLLLLTDATTAQAAVRGLATYDHPRTASTILEHYSAFDPDTRQDALQTLASKRTWAAQLMAAVEANDIAPSDMNAYTVRQLQSLGDPNIAAKVRKVWGEVRATPADKAKLIARYKQQLTVDVLVAADTSAGRELFNRTCANCHRLFGEGKQVGPDITGAQRSNLDYLLENLVDPSGAVSRDYQMHVVLTTDGRVITGLLTGENDQAITIQSVNERIVLPLDEIDTRALSPVSMMPDGQLQKLSNTELRDLIAYLSSRVQVPLPGG